MANKEEYLKRFRAQSTQSNILIGQRRRTAHKLINWIVIQQTMLKLSDRFNKLKHKKYMRNQSEYLAWVIYRFWRVWKMTQGSMEKRKITGMKNKLIFFKNFSKDAIEGRARIEVTLFIKMRVRQMETATMIQNCIIKIGWIF